MSTELHTPPPTGSRSETAYRVLKHSLLLGEFPIAHRLGEERLASRLGTSRTPVREALARLHAEGLVRRHPEGGYEPVFPDMARIAELYEVRSTLELLALRRHVGTLDEGGPTGHDREQLLALQRDWTAMTHDVSEQLNGEFVLVDEDFHLRLAQSSGNGSIAEFLEQVNERIRIVRVHDFLAHERIEATIVEHLAILDALLADDTDTAADRLRLHITESADVASARATTTLLRMLSGRS